MITFLFFVDFIRDPQMVVLRPRRLMAWWGPHPTQLKYSHTWVSSSFPHFSFSKPAKTKRTSHFLLPFSLCMSYFLMPKWRTSHTIIFPISQAFQPYCFWRNWAGPIFFSKHFFLVEPSKGKPLLSPCNHGFSRPLGSFPSCMQGSSLRTPLFSNFCGFWVGFPWGFWCRLEVGLKRKFVGVIRICLGVWGKWIAQLIKMHAI